MRPGNERAPALGVAERLRAGIPALAPLAWAYGVVAAGLSRSLRPARPGTGVAPRIISIGNLEVGGSGKTPLALHLLDIYGTAGARAAYASRGFGGRCARGPLVTLVPPRDGGVVGSGAGSRIVGREAPDLAAEIGDEGAVVAGRLPNVPLALGRDKRAAVRALARGGADVVIVDDGFQSWRLPRHVDVVLLDSERPIGSGRTLPAGSLRERPAAISRADVIVFNGARDASDVERARRSIERWIRRGTAVGGMKRAITLVRCAGDGTAVPARAMLVAGIARPDAFLRDIRSGGTEAAGCVLFRDHHPYDREDVARIARAAERSGADGIVTTEKDWVKLRAFEWRTPVWSARLEVKLFGLDPMAWVASPK